MIFLIKYSIDSDIFKPVLADVLKHPQNSLFFANSFNSFSSGSPSIRSALFSTKMQGSFPPSKNVAASSTDDFHLIVLFNYLIILFYTYSSLVWTFVASDKTTTP